MSSVVISGDTSGAITLSSPAVSGTNTQTLVATTGTLAPIVSGTAVASTSGTSIDFTSIPSWVKRITVMFNETSTSGTSQYLIQLGSGSVTTTGYTSTGTAIQGTAVGANNSSIGFLLGNTDGGATWIKRGASIFQSFGSNIWVGSSSLSVTNAASDRAEFCAGKIALAGVLDRVRITTVNGTDTFDAGSINILYE